MKAFKRRRGVFDAGIIILGAIIVIIAIIAATLAWSDIMQVTYVSLITTMPKFDYNVEDGFEFGNKNFEMYHVLRNVSFLLIVFVLMFAGMSIMFEKINLVPPETGFKIISKSIYFVFFFFFFPPLWDILANSVEQFAVWILNPQDPAASAKNIEVLLKKLGSIECADPIDPNGNCQFTLDKLVAGITDPFGTLKNIFQTSFLGVFKAIAFLVFMFFSFLIGTIRQVLTAIVIIGLPILMILSLLPFFKRIVDKFIDALLGLLIAPIFSALVIVAGASYLGTLVSPDPIIEWFAALGIMALASLMPAMIVPMMGPVLGIVHGMASSAMSAGAMLTGLAGIGITQGALSGSGLVERMRSFGGTSTDMTKLGLPLNKLVTKVGGSGGPAKLEPAVNQTQKNRMIPNALFDGTTQDVSGMQEGFAKLEKNVEFDTRKIPSALFDAPADLVESMRKPFGGKFADLDKDDAKQDQKRPFGDFGDSKEEK